MTDIDLTRASIHERTDDDGVYVQCDECQDVACSAEHGDSLADLVEGYRRHVAAYHDQPEQSPGVPVVTIEHGNRRTLTVTVDGEIVATTNYDECGWSGLEAVERTAVAITRAFGGEVINTDGR